ncbi:MAG: hypothetical protein IJ422_05845 [Oscillospiraceae bacterium]|nr:hypothetical protein [Oscillospiraceae bacterium]
MEKKGLSQETLKLIACVTMLIDHVGAVLLPSVIWLRAIGRLAFPIYCFLLAEGFHYTKSRKKYALRLFIGMLLSEIPFDLAFFRRPWWGYQSVMVTLFIALLMMWALDKIPSLWLKCLAVLPFCLAAELLHTDYAGAGVMVAALFYLTREHPKRHSIQGLGMIILCYLIGGMEISVGPVCFPIELLAVLALVPLWLYQGKKRTASRALQWGFYLFYPVHLLALWFISSRIF